MKELNEPILSFLTIIGFSNRDKDVGQWYLRLCSHSGERHQRQSVPESPEGARLSWDFLGVQWSGFGHGSLRVVGHPRQQRTVPGQD